MNPHAPGSPPSNPGRWRRVGELFALILVAMALIIAGTTAYLTVFGSPSTPQSISTIKIQTTYQQEGINAPVTVRVHANVTGGEVPYTYLWNFDDGNISTSGPSAEHTYLSIGGYNIQLTVTCLGGMLKTVHPVGTVFVN